MFWAMGSSLGLNNSGWHWETAEDSTEGSLVWPMSRLTRAKYHHTQIIPVRITSNSINASLVLSHMVSTVTVTGPRRAPVGAWWGIL